MTTDPRTVRRRLLLVLWAAAGVSVAANILAAQPSAVGRAVAAWPPLALLLVVEVLARSPIPTGILRWAATGGAACVAVVAAVASFHHMHTVARSVGESPLVAVLFPLSVDGLAVVASVALLGTGPDPTRPHSTPTPDTGDQGPAPRPAPSSEPTTATAGRPVEGRRSVPASVSLFVPANGGARSPVLNGTGSKQPTTTS
jgi:hypothetical protein